MNAITVVPGRPDQLHIGDVAGLRPEQMVFMMLYIAAFTVGMGPVFWVLIGKPSRRTHGPPGRVCPQR